MARSWITVFALTVVCVTLTPAQQPAYAESIEIVVATGAEPLEQFAASELSR